MLSKYTIEYVPRFRTQAQTHHYAGDDPVACQEFLTELLEHGYHIKQIRHEGVDLPRSDFDKMIRTAGGVLAGRSICASLGISTEEEHHRFGFTG
jgi:hypothetical protein